MSAKKGLILVFRNESSDDFKEIARRVYKIDPTIRVLGFGDRIDPAKVPLGFFNLPHLVIYLCNPPPVDFVHGSPMLTVGKISKVDQYQYFQKYDLPSLPIEKFEWGKAIDTEIYGDFVILKPTNMTSNGRDINMVPSNLVNSLKPSDFPKDHLIHEDEYLVQKMLKTGDYPSSYRATVFLDEVVFSYKTHVEINYPTKSDSISKMLSTSLASGQKGMSVIDLHTDKELNQFALKVSKAFPQQPLLGIDIIRDGENGKPYVLEVNAGGNVWHFSSDFAKKGREKLGGKKAMVLQYNAWDRAAEALIRKVNELAR